MSIRNEFENNAKIENMIWEIAKILNPHEYIDPKDINLAKEKTISILKKQK